jgi:glycosyltransferase involved in cell wall biosynthesis
MVIKILYITNQIAFNWYGGAEVQIMKTIEYVNELNEGVNIELFNMWDHKIEDYDIIHIFKPTNFQSESLSLAKFANDRGIKTVISPIYYQTPEMRERIFPNRFIKYLTICRDELSKLALFNSLDPFRSFKRLANMTDMFLPNTQAEKEYICKTFSISPAKCFLIPNAVEPEYAFGNTRLFKDKHGFDNYILFVGRIEPRKNLDKLIKCFVESELETKLVIIGKIADKEYHQSCIKESNENVLFLPPMPSKSELLMSAYKAAKVVALPSYFETPGLAALEGGLAGANIVITECGGTKEYFKDLAWYVDPKSDRDIKDALISAYNARRSSKLQKHISEHFTWDKVAKEMVNVYKGVMLRNINE